MKKYILFLLIAILSIQLSACGSPKEATTSNPDLVIEEVATTPSTEEPVTEEPITEEASTEIVSEENTIQENDTSVVIEEVEEPVEDVILHEDGSVTISDELAAILLTSNTFYGKSKEDIEWLMTHGAICQYGKYKGLTYFVSEYKSNKDVFLKLMMEDIYNDTNNKGGTLEFYMGTGWNTKEFTSRYNTRSLSTPTTSEQANTPSTNQQETSIPTANQQEESSTNTDPNYDPLAGTFDNTVNNIMEDAQPGGGKDHDTTGVTVVCP